MSDIKDYLKYFRILEIKPDVPFSEVRSSYLHLRELYSSRGSALSSMMETLAEDKQVEIVEQLKEAYDRLKEYYALESKQKTSVTRETVSNQRIPEFEVFSGEALRLIREVLKIELEEVALATGIPHRHLQNIEKEAYDQLPPLGYIKAFVRKYAEFLFLDPAKVTDDYLKRYANRHKRKNRFSF